MIAFPSTRAQAQQLTPQQIASRLAAYNGDGSFERELAELWADAGEVLESTVRAEAGDKAAAEVRSRFVNPFDAKWLQDVADFGITIFNSGRSVPAVIDRRARIVAAMCAALRRHLGHDEAKLARSLETMQRLSAYENEMILAQVALLEANAAAEARGKQSESFERIVTDLVTTATSESATLRERTASTASAARGMLGKTSEVAAAAEQSAVAMREAAQTAAGLIRAIEDARSEVEVAAGVATRAGNQAEDAVKVSHALSAHVAAIESILGLIRDIAG